MADKKEPAERDVTKPNDGSGNETAGGTASEVSPQQAPEHPVTDIIEAFGGLRPMAGKLKVAVSTVQGWKERDSIPTARHSDILEAAKAHNIALDPAALAASDHVARDQGGKTAPANNGSKDQTVKKKETESSSQDKAAQDRAAQEKAAGDAKKADAVKDSADKAGGGAAKTAIPATGAAKASDADQKKAASQSSAPKNGTPDSSAKSGAASVPKPVPAQKSGGWLGGFLLGVIVLALVLAGAVYSRSAWLPLVEGLPVMAGAEGGGEESSDGAAQQIAALEAKVAALESQLQSAPAAETLDLTEVDTAIAEANKRIDVLDETLEQLLAGGVIIAPDAGSAAPAGDAAPGSVLDSQELASLKAQVEQLAGQLQSGNAGAASQAGNGPLEDLNARLGDLEAKLAALPDPADRLAALDSRLSAAEQGVAGLPALESRLSGELAALNAALPKGPSEEAGDAAMFLALLQLRQALSGSGAFEPELALIQGLAAEDADLTAALAPLADHAAGGIPALPGLQASFGAMASKVVAASRGGEEGDWVGKTLQKVSEIVTVRPVGLVEGDDPGAVLARAEVKLEAGDLAGAVAELDGLSGAAAEGAAGWRQEAAARLDAEKALSLLATRAASLIGLGG